jgi:hypothetical protein
MSSQRFAMMAAALCGTVAIAGWVIAAVGGFRLAGIKHTDEAPIEDRASALSGDAKPVDAPQATAMDMAGVSNAGAARTGGSGEAETIVEAPSPDSPQSATVNTRDPVHTDANEAVSSTETLDESLPDSPQMLAPETPPVQIATVRSPDPVHTDAKEAVRSAETLDESLPDSSQTLAPETSPLRIATARTPDPVHTDAKEAVSATETLDKSLPDSSQMLAPQTPPGQIATVSTSDPVHTDTKEAVSSSETLDECLVPEVCIDQYLWSVYQRTPKQDTVKVVERKKVIVRIKGKPRTVIQEFTKLLDEDFTWKDPKAAERAGMSLIEYVIGGMDRDFKLKLYHALRALDDAGLSPGITSAFRDDYRQSLASGLKAATDRSYHGGSFRGGYGHGLAADLVSVRGETRAERLISSENMWKWIDAHGKELGIGRPYLDKDPPHVAPIDGKEYVDHRRGENTQHARSEIKKRNLLTLRDHHSAAKPARTARSSKVLRSI